jgi:hypothetical protein
VPNKALQPLPKASARASRPLSAAAELSRSAALRAPEQGARVLFITCRLELAHAIPSIQDRLPIGRGGEYGVVRCCATTRGDT